MPKIQSDSYIIVGKIYTAVHFGKTCSVVSKELLLKGMITVYREQVGYLYEYKWVISSSASLSIG